MFNSKKLHSLIGLPLAYKDNETGLAWDIEIFDVYREMIFDSTTVLLSDNVKVKLNHIDITRGPEHIFKKILEGYEQGINNLEYKNG